MNFARVVLAAVAALVFDGVYGFLVYGMLLVPSFAQYPGVYRSNEAGAAYLPLMFAGILVAVLVAAYIYAKGYDGGNGLAEGTRFGALLGLFMAGAFAGVNYATLNIGRRHSLEMAIAGFFEWFGIGLVIGLVYKPAAGSRR